MSEKIENTYELRPLIEQIPEDWRYRIDEIAERTGFSSASYYSKIFKKVYGISPLKYRKTKSG